MSPKKKATSDADVAVLDAPQVHARNRRMTGLAIAGVVAVAVCYFVWQHVRPHVVSSSQYLVEVEQIAVTPPPAWVHGDVKGEALRDAHLEGPLSLLEADLTVRVASAFAGHPWVARVERVSKHYPAGLDVVLAYRQPVAMVEVQDGAAAYPIDGQGVVLPTRDFSPEDSARYLHITEIHTTPAGTVGSEWGDPLVKGAATIAAALAADWQKLELIKIVPAGRKPGRGGAEPVYTLYTRSGTSIDWGRATGDEAQGELPAAEKVALLNRYAAQNKGSLDLENGDALVIREDGALMARPHPSIRALPSTDEN